MGPWRQSARSRGSEGLEAPQGKFSAGGNTFKGYVSNNIAFDIILLNILYNLVLYLGCYRSFKGPSVLLGLYFLGAGAVVPKQMAGRHVIIL